MTTIVAPGQSQAEPHRAGKLANALWSIAVAASTEPARLTRGRAYAADGAVQRIEVSNGTIVATVQGSQPNPYQVNISVATTRMPELAGRDALRNNLGVLTPDTGELTTSCTCADWDSPCKHAVAALVAFGKELIVQPELLIELRCVRQSVSPSEVGTGTGTGTRGRSRHLRLASVNNDRPAASDRPSPWQRPEWLEFLGGPPAPEPDIPNERAKVGRSMLGTIDLGAWVGSALDQFTLDD